MAKKRIKQTAPKLPPARNAPKPVEELPDPADHPGVADRATMLEWLRSELVGPQLRDHFPRQAQLYVQVPHILNALPIQQGDHDTAIQVDPAQHTVLFHTVNGREQEIIWYRESPRQRYGT